METHREVPNMTLNNGLKMPQIGLGTFEAPDAEIEPIVKEAILKHGYRHIDTASVYGNEEAIGRALQACFAEGIQREEVFIVTKVWRDEMGDVEGALRNSLKKL